MDRIDKRILELLQNDASLSVTSIADRVGLSKAPCWRRIQRLHQDGIILRTVALLHPKRLNLGTTVFVAVKTGTHSSSWFASFLSVVRDMSQITEIYRMSGDVDYLLRIVVPSIDEYDDVYKRLIAACEFSDVNASFALETIKWSTALPLQYCGISASAHRGRSARATPGSHALPE